MQAESCKNQLFANLYIIFPKIFAKSENFRWFSRKCKGQNDFCKMIMIFPKFCQKIRNFGKFRIFAKMVKESQTFLSLCIDSAEAVSHPQQKNQNIYRRFYSLSGDAEYSENTDSGWIKKTQFFVYLRPSAVGSEQPLWRGGTWQQWPTGRKILRLDPGFGNTWHNGLSSLPFENVPVLFHRFLVQHHLQHCSQVQIIYV